jgi:hypothetical protein
MLTSDEELYQLNPWCYFSYWFTSDEIDKCNITMNWVNTGSRYICGKVKIKGMNGLVGVVDRCWDLCVHKQREVCFNWNVYITLPRRQAVYSNSVCVGEQRNWVAPMKGGGGTPMSTLVTGEVSVTWSLHTTVSEEVLGCCWRRAKVSITFNKLLSLGGKPVRHHTHTNTGCCV